VEMMPEVQDLLTGLALEYLRATLLSGAPERVQHPTHLEWLTILRQVLDRLERGLRQVAARPHWGITREPMLVPAERVRRTDTDVRSSVRRGRGAGQFLDLGDGLIVRERVHERRARPTLDTSEHRWLAAQ